MALEHTERLAPKGNGIRAYALHIIETGAVAEGTENDSDGQPNALARLVARVVAVVDQWQRRHSLLGFPIAVVKKYGDDNGGKQAALLTYYGFLSIFPILLLAVFTLTHALANDAELRADVIEAIVPPELQDAVDGAVTSLPTGGLPLVVGIIGLLFTATGIVFTAYDMLNHLAGVPHRARLDMVPRYLRGFLVLVLLLVSMAAIGLLTALSSNLIDVGAVSTTTAAAGVLAISFGLLLVSARLLIARPVRFAALWPAAALGAIAVSTLVLVFSPLLARFVGRSGPVYGSFATIVGMFALLYLVSQVLVYSAEIAVVRRRRLWPRALDMARPTRADRRALTGLARMEERTAVERVAVSFADPAPPSPPDPGHD